MTTPQSVLYDLQYKFNQIMKFIEGDRDSEGVIGRLTTLEEQSNDLINSLQRIENLLNVMIKLLAKDDK